MQGRFAQAAGCTVPVQCSGDEQLAVSVVLAGEYFRDPNEFSCPAHALGFSRQIALFFGRASRRPLGEARPLAISDAVSDSAKSVLPYTLDFFRTSCSARRRGIG